MIWGSTRAGEKGALKTSGQETRDLRRESPWDQKRMVRRSRPVGEGSDLIQLRRKKATKKVETTGFNRDVATLRASKGERTKGGEASETGTRSRDSGDERDAIEKVEGGKAEIS